MGQEGSKGAEIILRLLALLERYLVETVAQRTALDMLCEFWPGEEEIDWHLLVDASKNRIARGAAEQIELIRGILLEELSQGHPQPLAEWEKIVQRLIESVEDIDRPE